MSTSTINVHSILSLKLNSKNYPLWREQAIALADSQEVLGHLTGDDPVPTQTQTSSDANAGTQPNPDYVKWKKADRLLRGWLIGSLSEESLGLVIGLDTAKAVWDALKRAYAQESQEREFNLKQQITYMRKDDSKTINEHVQYFKGLCDSLCDSLRHVNVCDCILKFPDDDNHEADLSGDQILDKVVSFSNPNLYTGKDVKRLLQRLTVVRKLSCALTEFPVYDEETLDFYVELESLTLQTENDFKRQYIMMKFPSTLKKLTLERFLLPWTALSSIAELQCLEVLKLRYNSFGEPYKLETEDLVFRNLKFFQLRDHRLEEWNASPDSFPCLEQLVIHCDTLKELPPCFGEMSTLKMIAVNGSSRKVEKSALRIQEEVMELGIQLEVSIF